MDFAAGFARCPGTCGEWVQGAREGIPFLVGCPIDRFSEARVALSFDNSGWDIPLHKTKARQVLDLLKSDLNLPWLGGRVDFSRQLPEGKGMASSTADITAVAAATLTALEEDLAPQRLANLALRIEPSDSVMFPGITALEHVHRHHFRVLGPAIPASFLALDWGGSVDTRQFNARPGLAEHYRCFEGQIAVAFDLAREGIEKGDLEKLARAGTISAQCNLEINPKALFEPFLSWVRKKGGLGVITAHSGTLLAGVFPQDSFSGREDRKNLQFEAYLRFEPDYLDFYNSHSAGITARKLTKTLSSHGLA